MSINQQLAELKDPATKSAYDAALEELALNVRRKEVRGVVANLALVGDGKARLALPALPAGGKWALGGLANAVAQLQGKVATTGSAGTTTAVL
jgi:hypothetical protein